MKKMVLIPYDQFTNCKQTQDHTDQVTLPKDLERLDRELILIPFGKIHYKHASSLLSYVERNMNWNERGEIIIRGDIIVGSHITDLLRDAMYSYKNFNPVGFVLFYQNLSSIPLSLIRNPKRKYLVGSGAGDTGRSNNPLEDGVSGSQRPNIPPPPGLPLEQEPIELNTSISDWKSSWKKI